MTGEVGAVRSYAHDELRIHIAGLRSAPWEVGPLRSPSRRHPGSRVRLLKSPVVVVLHLQGFVGLEYETIQARSRMIYRDLGNVRVVGRSQRCVSGHRAIPAGLSVLVAYYSQLVSVLPILRQNERFLGSQVLVVPFPQDDAAQNECAGRRNHGRDSVSRTPPWSSEILALGKDKWSTHSGQKCKEVRGSKWARGVNRTQGDKTDQRYTAGIALDNYPSGNYMESAIGCLCTRQCIFKMQEVAAGIWRLYWRKLHGQEQTGIASFQHGIMLDNSL